MNRRTQNELMRRLRSDADRICHRFGLRYRSLEPERANVKRRYGICYDDGSIKIRLRHVATGEPLKYSSLVNTLCHELAHLKHFNHGPHFKAFYAQLLEWARREGIYCPGPVGRPRETMRRDRPDPGTRPSRPPERRAPPAHATKTPVPANPELPLFAESASPASRPASLRSPRVRPQAAPVRPAAVQLDLFV